MIRIQTANRLHFGLFRLPTQNVRERRFGGVGLMIDKPGVALSAARAGDWSATGPCAERALEFARQYVANSPEVGPLAFHINVENCPPEHVGLGTGTQLGMAVALALAKETGQVANLSYEKVGRGLRSGIGVHGFFRGGLLVDGGKGPSTSLAPLVVRHDFPDDWGIVLVLSQGGQGLHGPPEVEAFAELACADQQPRTDALCRLVLLGMLPALMERDLSAFGEALYEFNRRVGEMFAPWQGGTYASPRTAALVDFFRNSGVAGTGQSSWGPTAFAICSAEQCSQLAGQVTTRFGLSSQEVHCCRGFNRPAEVK
jgi:beta-ribofuranosylaminobenzene 5'-phosphate synthase